ncbi:histidine phosphatase family protein [Nitratireductor sp. CAU 1489]|uniref:Histidine phosphatase family protein n=1 Tax=Nitratireductor arenosus TaxID=2682096 RepID=A0A844QGA2_9HYPH|nr:histidine phosphatase family protein [Nitratireductor arenosus]MVA97644.1 histidine phosphatase family protein [Nitratireductor arenosus]
MSRLFLLRHAKAAWAEPGGRDFDRALTEDGRDEATAIGAAMRAGGHVPSRVMCSPARRALETWQGVANALGHKAGAALMSNSLYGSDPSAYLTIMRNNGDAEALLIVGHNPMIEELAFAFARHGNDDARQRLARGFPTAGLAVFSFARPLFEASAADARLEAFLTPERA